jgi:hypothetical protein
MERVVQLKLKTDHHGFDLCHVKHIPGGRPRALLTSTKDMKCEHVFITPVDSCGYELLVGINYSQECMTESAAKVFINNAGDILMDAIPYNKHTLQHVALSRALAAVHYTITPSPLNKFICKELGETFKTFVVRALTKLIDMARGSPEPYKTAICNIFHPRPEKIKV